MKHKLINGFTQESMIAQITTRNNGTKSGTDPCLYHDTDNDNHCAVGCFIPDDHLAMEEIESAVAIRHAYPDLVQHWPLTTSGMNTLQGEHDQAENDTTDMHNILTTWILENTYE